MNRFLLGSSLALLGALSTTPASAAPQKLGKFVVRSQTPYAQESNVFLQKLSELNTSLPDIMKQAAPKAGTPFIISAKVEMDDAGKALNGSVYTAKKGRQEIPENNPLIETQGGFDPHGAWNMKAAPFRDKTHIARAALHLGLAQESSASLDEVIVAASKAGRVYRVEPEIYQGRPAFHVLVMTPAGTAEQLKIALPVRR